MNHQQAVGKITDLVQWQAIMLPTNQLFLGCAILFVITAVTIWFAPKPARITGPSLGH